MDAVVSVATTILEKLVEEAILQACYPFRVNKYFKELEIEKEKLQSKIQEVQDRAKDAKKKTHKVVGKVEEWFNKADFLMAEVVVLQEKTKKRNKTSCLKHCPNLINHYNLAKQLEEKTKDINTHNQVQFSEFSRLDSLVGMNYFPSQDFVHFDSRKVAYDRLLRALKDDGIHMIGLYGMGGSGKTTLVKEVGIEAENFFDKVLFVVVSNTYDVRKIQSKIANQLSFELKEEEKLERARRLFMRLTSGERFLIILDDVWEKLDFMDIGIPTANNQMGCTVVITTRNFHVCELMSCQKVIHLEVLNEDESWDLFQKHAGLLDDLSNNLKDMAQNITKVCDGLPIAIEAVAKTLKNKPHHKWVEALKILRNPSWIDIEERLKSTYGCLRLSYDNLDNEAVKSLFLLCSMYPEDYEISIDELTIIGLGLGLVGEIHSYWAKTQLVSEAITKLVGSCLLLKLEDGNHVKMHDLVRDVALWIAQKEDKLIMGQLKEDTIMKAHEIRYLWLEEVDKCPNKLNCFELEFLHISMYSEPNVTIPNDFFNGMEKLRVLFLENPTDKKDIPLQWPISFNLLSNLCCLMLYCWVLGDISFIRSFERLESLKIWDCSFDELPKCIKQQQKLRLLDLRGCKIQRSPFEVIGRCSQLEVLYFCGNSGTDWEYQNNNSAIFFDKISTNASALESYCIHFGNGDEDFWLHRDLEYCNSFVSRSLYVEDFENCISIATSKDMMRRAKTLSLRGIPRSWKNIIPDLWQTIGGGMNDLTHLAIHDSDGIECVIGHARNISQVGIISNLTSLTLSQVKHLKTLYSGQPPQGLFTNLENLRIHSCDSLEHILTEDVKEIVGESEYHSFENAFPRLKALTTFFCKQLEYLVPISIAKSLAHLETLDVGKNDKLRSVFGKSLNEDLKTNKPQIIEFSALELLFLEGMPNITSICPENYHPTWPSLKTLNLHDCPQLNIKSINHWVASGGLKWQDIQMSSEELAKVVVAPLKTLQNLGLLNDEVEVVFDVEQLPVNEKQVNLSLRDVRFGKLLQLRHIWRGPKSSLFLQHLDLLQLVSCRYLKEVFPSSILKSLPQLRVLYIVDCNELEEIIEEDDQNVSNSHQLVFPRLASIYIKRCHNLKCVFPKISSCQKIPNLRVLSIENASGLEQVFGHEQLGTTHTYDVFTPALEYVLLWNLPSLTSVAPSIALQTVEYIVVQQCPKLSLTSSVTPQELLKQLSKGYLDDRYTLKTGLEDIIKSMDDSSRESTQQIVCQETRSQINDQKLKFIASPNLTDSVEGRVEECTTSKNVKIFTPLSHSKPESSTKTVRDLEGQSARMENISRRKDIEGNIEGSPSSKNTEIITPSTESKLTSSLPGILVTSSPNTVPHIQSQIKLNSRKSDVEKDGKATPTINLQDLKDDDLIKLLESMEDDYGGKSPILYVPTIATTKVELAAKALADLEDSLKMPFKDIATSEANSLRLQTALNFLSHVSLEDGALPHGVMAMIKSMHKDLTDILPLFKEAFATVNKFIVLEERDKSIKDELTQRKEVAIALVAKMSETQMFMDEAKEKKARLQEQISRLEKQTIDRETELLSLQERKSKYIAEAIELKKEIETMRKEKSEMVEDQRNARQQLFEVDHRWSGLGSQFEHNITLVSQSVNQIKAALEIPAVKPTSSPRPQSISKQSATNPVDVAIHQTPSNQDELVNTITTSQSESKCQQQQSLAKNEITKKSIGDLEGQSAQKENISRDNDVKGISEGSLSSENAKIIAPSTDSKLATSSTKFGSHIQSQIKFNPKKSYDEDMKDDDLISMLESMEHDYGVKSPILSVPTVATTKDELVAKALADLEDSLKMPLKDIATSDANSLRLQTALNFLSRLSLEDGAPSHGVMAIIKSMHKDLPNIMSSFKQAFATVNKFTMLEERDKSIKDELSQRKEVAIALVAKMSETQKFMDEAQEKKARLQEQIFRLEKETTDREAELLSLQERKSKYIAEAIELKNEIETVRKEKLKMVEDQINAQQQLFQVDHKWSDLGSQFEHNIADRNLS